VDRRVTLGWPPTYSPPPSTLPVDRRVTLGWPPTYSPPPSTLTCRCRWVKIHNILNIGLQQYAVAQPRFSFSGTQRHIPPLPSLPLFSPFTFPAFFVLPITVRPSSHLNAAIGGLEVLWSLQRVCRKVSDEFCAKIAASRGNYWQLI